MQLFDFKQDIFKTYKNTAKITDVILEWKPYYSEEYYRFHCISKEERDATNDECNYWYVLYDDEDDE